MVVEGNDALGWAGQVGDNKADKRGHRPVPPGASVDKGRTPRAAARLRVQPDAQARQADRAMIIAIGDIAPLVDI
jgi:hypothetical protein